MREKTGTRPANDYSPTEEGASSARGHIGLIVLSSIAVGLGLGLVLDLLVFGGSRETVITGCALLSLAIGCAMLAALSARRTNQPQRWAILPAVCFGVTGAAILILRPSSHILGLLGWVWPILLVVLVVWMFRGSRRSLHSWSRRALLYPAFVLLALVAVGGAFETVVEAATSNKPPSGGRTYVVAGHSLYLQCVGSGSPAVILFNGLGERTPSWAWVQGEVARQTRVCVFDRAGQGWSGKGVGRQDAHQLSADVRGLLAAADVPGPYVLAGHSVGGVYALAYAMDYPTDVAGVALIDSATPYQFDLPWYPGFYSLWRRASALLPTLARAGIARVTLGMIGSGSLPADARRQARAFASSPRELSADRDEFAELRTVLDQVKALTSLGAKPPIRPDGRRWAAVGLVRRAGPVGRAVDQQCSSDDPRCDTRGAGRRGKLRGCYCPSDQCGRSLSADGGLLSVAAIAQPVRARLRTPVIWGLVIGAAQAATPLAFWWLDTATVYALGLVVIAPVYIGFAVADGRRNVLAVESGVAGMFVIIAAAAITGTPWLLVVGLAGHGLKDFWQHRRQFVANTRWWPPFCLVVDWVVAAIIAVEIVAGVQFH